MNALMSTAEQEKFKRCETTIQAGFENWLEVSQALLTIRDDGLYRDTFKTFEEYCNVRWNMKARRAYQLIEAAVACSDLRPGTPAPTNERQGRELAQAPAERRDEVMNKAEQVRQQAQAPAITSTHVRQAVESLDPSDKPLGPASFDSSEEPPQAERVVVDGTGFPIHDHKLRHVFEETDVMMQVITNLRRCRQEVESIIKAPCGERVHRSTVMSHIKNAIDELRLSVPHSMCIYCTMEDDKCAKCKGTHWLTNGQWQAAPEPLREQYISERRAEVA
jgi:hypothetical protein